MEYRKLEKKDIGALVGLVKEVWGAHFNAQELKALMMLGKFYGIGVFEEEGASRCFERDKGLINQAPTNNAPAGGGATGQGKMAGFLATDPEKPPEGDSEGYGAVMLEPCIVEGYDKKEVKQRLVYEFLKIVPLTEATAVSIEADSEHKELVEVLLEVGFDFAEAKKLKMVWVNA